MYASELALEIERGVGRPTRHDARERPTAGVRLGGLSHETLGADREIAELVGWCGRQAVGDAKRKILAVEDRAIHGMRPHLDHRWHQIYDTSPRKKSAFAVKPRAAARADMSR